MAVFFKNGIGGAPGIFIMNLNLVNRRCQCGYGRNRVRGKQCFGKYIRNLPGDLAIDILVGSWIN